MYPKLYFFFQNKFIRNTLPPILLEGMLIQRVYSTKFLGVYIDENLNWNCHTEEVCLKISKVCDILYSVRNYLTTDALLSNYYTLCCPYINYCISVWACTWHSFLDKLRVAQKNIIRRIFFLSKFGSTAYYFLDTVC